MKKWMYVLVSLMMLLSAVSVFAEETATPLTLTEIGMFSAGGTVTEPVEGDYDPTTNWMDANRPGNTAHVDHANVLYTPSGGRTLPGSWMPLWKPTTLPEKR